MQTVTALDRAGTAEQAGNRGWQVRLWLAPFLVGLVAYAVAIAAAAKLLNDGDTLSHIAIGHSLPGSDHLRKGGGILAKLPVLICQPLLTARRFP